MSYQNFFTPPGVAQDTNFFDEGPRIVVKPKSRASSYVNSSSIDTSTIDGYRQGIELTQIKFFDAGIVKIHAGEPGHVLRRNHFGEDKNFRTDPRFQELDYFNPVTFLRAQAIASPLLTSIITFPIITGDNDQIENYYFDGIIEPLLIREVASFFSIEAPLVSRSVKGALMQGNNDSTAASDQVVTVDYFEPDKQQVAYLDLVDIIEGQPLNGYFDFRKSTRDPFNDARFIRNVASSSNYTTKMLAALSIMSGSTDNYISFKQRSYSAGFYYDNTPVGTDSIAFGGMTY